MIKLIKRTVIWLIVKIFGDAGKVWLESESMIRKLKNGYYWEKEISLLQHLLSSGDICLDVGANFGQWTYWMSKQVGSSGKVIAVEPVPLTVSVLRCVVNRMRLGNVDIKQIAVGNRNSLAGIRMPKSENAFDGLLTVKICDYDETFSSDITVNMVTLKSLMESLEFDKLKLIKCDIEGAELQFFQGGIHILEQYNPAIICEIEEKHSKEFGYHPDDLFSLLQSIGYRPFKYTLNELVPVAGIVPDSHNYIFLHKCDESISKLLQKIVR